MQHLPNGTRQHQVATKAHRRTDTTKAGHNDATTRRLQRSHTTSRIPDRQKTQRMPTHEMAPPGNRHNSGLGRRDKRQKVEDSHSGGTKPNEPPCTIRTRTTPTDTEKKSPRQPQVPTIQRLHERRRMRGTTWTTTGHRGRRTAVAPTSSMLHRNETQGNNAGRRRHTPNTKNTTRQHSREGCRTHDTAPNRRHRRLHKRLRTLRPGSCYLLLLPGRRDARTQTADRRRRETLHSASRKVQKTRRNTTHRKLPTHADADGSSTGRLTHNPNPPETRDALLKPTCSHHQQTHVGKGPPHTAGTSHPQLRRGELRDKTPPPEQTANRR